MDVTSPTSVTENATENACLLVPSKDKVEKPKYRKSPNLPKSKSVRIPRKVLKIYHCPLTQTMVYKNIPGDELLLACMEESMTEQMEMYPTPEGKTKPPNISSNHSSEENSARQLPEWRRKSLGNIEFKELALWSIRILRGRLLPKEDSEEIIYLCYNTNGDVIMEGIVFEASLVQKTILRSARYNTTNGVLDLAGYKITFLGPDGKPVYY